MSVFGSLSGEHALLLKLVDRLERAAGERDERLSARETRNILLVLFKALEAHQTLEHMVYDESPEPPTPGAYRALTQVRKQHEAVAMLRREAASLLNALTPEGGAAVRRLSTQLAAMLRRLIAEEENTLWPSFHAYAGRSTLHRLSRRAEAQFSAMKRDIARYWAEVEEYTKGG